MNKPRRSSAKSRRSSSRSVTSNLGESRNNPDVRITRTTIVPLSDIPSIKWREIIDDEEQYFIVNSIREEIIRSAMDAIYTRYLERTSYDFVVHCSHRAWVQLFNFIHLKHDSGENVQTIAEHWSYDKAPDPVPPDPWGCCRLTVHEEKIPSQEPNPCTAPCATKITVEPVITVPSFTCPSPAAESRHESSDSEELTEKEQISKPDIITERPLSSLSDRTSLASLSQRQRSIFTRTISMAKANLPVTTWQCQREFKDTNHVREKKFRTPAEAVQLPERLNLETLPPDRLDIKYLIIPEHGTNSVSHKKSKTRPLSSFKK